VAESLKAKPAKKTVKKAFLKRKTIKPEAAKAFNDSLKTINDRLSSLEQGQSQLFKRLDATDKKLDTLIERVNGMDGKPQNATKSSTMIKADPNVAGANEVIATSTAKSC
jgi:predicted transcriptional regulator